MMLKREKKTLEISLNVNKSQMIVFAMATICNRVLLIGVWGC